MQRINLIKNQLTKDSSKILVETAIDNKGIKIVYMNDGLNPLSKELINNLYTTLRKLDDDEETRVIILASKGKAFAAGADIKTLSKTSYQGIVKNDWFLQALEFISYHITKPLIAAVNGVAYGGGFELALSCDIIICSDKAKFAFPELKLGLFPGAGGTQRLARLMGYHKAMEYILTTKEIPLQELKSFGVVNEVVTNDNLINYSVEIAKNISKFSLMSVYAAKKAIKLSQETNLYAGLRSEKFLFEGLFNTEDKINGVNSFIAKKEVSFNDK